MDRTSSRGDYVVVFNWLLASVFAVAAPASAREPASDEPASALMEERMPLRDDVHRDRAQRFVGWAVLTAGLQVGASALVVAESTSDYGFFLVPAGLSTAAFVSGTIMFSSFAGWNLGRASLQDRDPRTVSRRRTAAWATGGTLLGVGLGALAGGVALGLRAPSERLQLAGVASAAFSYLPLSLAAGAFAYVGGLRGPRRRLSLTPRMEVPLEGGWSAGLGLSGWF